MQFKKPATTIAEQIALLKGRGLLFNDETNAAHYLSNISYYRLRAYTFPFQDELHPDHCFNGTVCFEDIISVYVFDRELRLLVFNAIEKIEIAIRTKLIYYFSLSYGSHWHENALLYMNSGRFNKDIDDLHKEIDRSAETFIKHYKNKYSTPDYPASWMSLEVASLGLLSKLFSNLRNGKEKKAICHDFGVRNYTILESWLHSICHVRNICAHHGRLWNRRLTAQPEMPKNPMYTFLNNKNINVNKLYAILSCMTNMLHIISPQNNFNTNLKTLLSSCDLIQLKEMGFPKGWEKEAIWQ
jgi:abortive infection bacteriophage resistance protein